MNFEILPTISNTIYFELLLALALGAIVGLKNEIELEQAFHGKQKKPKLMGGFRSHAMLSILGAVSALFLISGVPIFSVLITGGVVIMILLYYASGVFKGNAFGVTSELTSLFAHIVGILCVTQPVPIKYIVAMAVIVVFITANKERAQGIRQNISRQEMLEFTVFAVIALVVLPFLPNEVYTLGDLGIGNVLENYNIVVDPEILNLAVINPFKTWLIVVFVAGLDMVGYILSRFFAKDRSILITSAISGFVSSTSATVSLAIQSKEKSKSEDVNTLVAGALAANASSFVQVFLLLAPLSLALMKKVAIPTIVLVVGYSVAAVALNEWHKRKRALKDGQKKAESRSIEKKEFVVSVGPALKFALLLTVINFVSMLALAFWGKSAYVFTSMLASLVGMDAVVISLAQMVNVSNIGLELAMFTYMGANLVNLLSKIVYAFINGDREFALKFGILILLVFSIALGVGFVM